MGVPNRDSLKLSPRSADSRRSSRAMSSPQTVTGATEILGAPDAQINLLQAGAKSPRMVADRQYFGIEAAALRAGAERTLARLSNQSPDEQRIDVRTLSEDFLTDSAGFQSLMNSRGLFAHYASTQANFTVTMRSDDGLGSGWAMGDVDDIRRLDTKAISQVALDKALGSREAKAIEPGKYTVILEPAASIDLLANMFFNMNQRQADEGRSFLSKKGGGTKVGEKIVDERVTLLSDPRDPDLLSNTFDGQGLPARRNVFIENGVLKKLTYSRFWAQKNNKQPDAGTNAVKLVGGTQTRDDLIKSTTRGILVTRLWYLRQVDPRTVLYTGLTRDGTFLIENGKITKAVKNLRFNESPLFLLNNLEALGTTSRVAGTEAGGDVVMPVLKVRDFNFTSLSDAV